jgi:hypothetical protein
MYAPAWSARQSLHSGESPREWVVTRKLAERSSIQAFRAGPYVLIVAEGKLPSPGYEIDIVQSPLRIYPPQYDLVARSLPGIYPQVVTPYLYGETVRYPEDQSTVTVHHAEGSDQVEIRDSGTELSAYLQTVSGGTGGEAADEATGFSKKLSFDEAFANALASLPERTTTAADAMDRVKVVEIGGLFGGVAGFHDMYVRIRRTQDG